MVLKPRTETHCFNPRDYQVELLDKACKRNVIVQLGTGSGKTFIAVLLLKEYGVQLFAPLDKGGKRAFFIVEKVNLVEQQAAHIERHTKFKVGRIHGQSNSDVCNDKKICDIFMKDHHVIVITAQCLYSLITHAFIKLTNTCVLIFDECHHALGSKHPYRLIMADYKKLKEANEHVPRILGLTASLIKEKTDPKDLEEKLKKLESIMNSDIETASDLVSLSKFGAKPYEVVVICQNFKLPTPSDIESKVKLICDILEKVRSFVDTTTEINADLDLDPRRPIRDSLKTTKAVLEQLGPWAAWKMSQVWDRELSKLIKTQMLPDKAKLFLNLARTAMVTIRRILEPQMKPIRSLNDLKPFIPHRVVRLFEAFEMFDPKFQLERMKKKDESEKAKDPEKLSAIVFVDQRYVAYALQMIVRQIRNWEANYRFISCDYVVGASGSNLASNDNQGLQKRQADVLRKFHRSELNVLIATSVLEEGVDVKQCNVVVKFDRPLEMRSYVQSKGRARRIGSRYLILIEESQVEDCNNDLQDFQNIEKLLLERYRMVHNPVGQIDKIEKDILLDEVDSLVPEYKVESTGAVVKLTNAIPLVNRYCGKLPSDIFTRLVPHNRIIPVKEDGVTKYRAELLLPINSPIKNAIELNVPMANKKLAQMAVALEACKQLHMKGELDDNLLPKGRESIAKLLEHIDDEPDEYAPGLHAKVGSSKRKQLYDKKVARALNEALIEADQECYLYTFELERMREPEATANPKRRKFVDPNEYEYCFGFLSSSTLPKMPAFPVYLRQGDMRVRLVLSSKKVMVKPEELEDIKQFHNYLFSQVLQLCKSEYLMFDISANTPANTLVVPLNKAQEGDDIIYSINMSYVSQVVANMEKMPRVPDEETRKQFKFKAENYKDAIVMPWYRNVEQPAFYYVAEVLRDMHPDSQFPDENFTTFNQYFIKKYQLTIYDQEQSLLDVDFTSNRLNLLLPRLQFMRKRTYTNSSQTPSERSDSVDIPTPPLQSPSLTSIPGALSGHSSQRQILVPELMDIHPISATLWNIISALPSIFYRLNQLLLTDELRKIILTEAFGKMKEQVELSDNVEWAPLKYPIAGDDKESMTLKKIQHLREYNKKNRPKNEPEKPMLSNDDIFQIGVWDPLDAVRLGLDVSLSDHEKKFDGDGDDDTIGLIPGLHDGNISDEDEDDLGPFVMHDYKQRLTSQLKPNETVSHNDLWTPRDGIVPSGWGEFDDNTSEEIPFQILVDGLSGFNYQTLKEDLVRHVNIPAMPAMAAIPVPSPMLTSTESVSNNSNVDVEMKSAASVEKMETEVAEVDEEFKKKQEALLKVQETLKSVNLLDSPDKNVRKAEESVDLVEFDDDVEDDFEIKSGLTLDDEIEELRKGEILKTEEDAMALQVEEKRTNAGVVSTIPAKPVNFSFAKESPTVSVYAADVCHSDNDVGFGVSPCLLLTALTTSNASDGMSLERFETIGDSFLKYAVTDYLYHSHLDQHEGKLSFARSKEVSNCNLYRLGKKLGIPQLIVASKFDAHDSWLPPCYVPTTDFKAPNTADAEERDNEIERLLEGHVVEEKEELTTGWDEGRNTGKTTADGIETINFPKQRNAQTEEISPLPYNFLTQQNISDKAIADAMEALIGVHLLTLGPNPALKVMDWMGLKVIKKTDEQGKLVVPPPLLRFIDTNLDPHASERALNNIWQQFQFSQLEETIGYKFNDRAYLVQAFTHASYINNRITGCYQRLEFLGDAVLDYMITRFLFEDRRQYGPGVLTDLRSALVNNTIFASLAVKYDFQKYFIAMCPGLHHMIEKFVKLCAERNFDTNFNTEMYMATTEEEIDEGHEEDIEVPKAMGDIFESVAGAIYLDSERNLDVTWSVIYGLMKNTIEECCANPPRSPIRELMELESSKARFSKMERILETGKVRVTVDVGNNMRFTGMGRNYRIAKSTAAKRALRYLHVIEQQRSNESKA